ncbi:hypothetical protein EPN90_04655 [Patescibacteria group bacterium]|nr:MAG: hypothetical protein EPN90_04655 [Patescibacteria group bacterium]
MLKKILLSLGGFYLILAVMELLFRQPFGGLIYFTPLHNLLHWILGAVLLYSARLSGKTGRALAFFSAAVFILAFLLSMLAPGVLSDWFGYPLSWIYKWFYFLSAVAIFYGIFKSSPSTSSVLQ